MNKPIFNLNQPYTIAIRQQWLPPGAANCIVFNFNTVYKLLSDWVLAIYHLIYQSFSVVGHFLVTA